MRLWTVPCLLAITCPALAQEDLSVLKPDAGGVGPRKMLSAYLLAEARKHFDARRAAVAALQTPDDLQKRQRELREKFLSSLGGFPEKTPLNAQVVGKEQREYEFLQLSAEERYVQFCRERKEHLSHVPLHQIASYIGITPVALSRIRGGIALLAEDSDAQLAFRLANRAMQLQRSWKDGGSLHWRPFQIAFCLLALRSTIDPEDADRETMDLIWFPTGGGKTEAYLLLTAFAIFHRRLRREPTVSGGVTVLMRYTLRLLTVQQYERAAALIGACEVVRTKAETCCDDETAKKLRSGPPISLGLWVGRDSSPNDVDEAVEALATGAASTPAQVRDCPSCKGRLKWARAHHAHQIWATCETVECALAAAGDHLPIWTVDEDVYR